MDKVPFLFFILHPLYVVPISSGPERNKLATKNLLSLLGRVEWKCSSIPSPILKIFAQHWTKQSPKIFFQTPLRLQACPKYFLTLVLKFYQEDNIDN